MKGILFDKDGTLIDFYKVWGPTVRPAILNIINDCGLEPEEALISKLKERIGVKGEEIDPEGAFAWKPFDLIAEDLYEEISICIKSKADTVLINKAEFKERAVRCFLLEAEKTEDYPAFTDLKRLFENLKKYNLKCGLATTDNTVSVMRTVKKLGIEEYLTFYGTADNGMPVKPDAGLIEKAADAWKCQKSEIMVVGDTPNDMRFAKNGGAMPVAVLSGTAKADSLRKYTENIIPSVDELMGFLHKENIIKEII